MVNLILIALLIISFFFVKRYGFCGIASFFMLCGSTTDSAGILYAIDSGLPIYKVLIWILTFLLLFISIIIIVRNNKSKIFMRWYFAPFVLSLLLMIISVLYQGGNIGYLTTSMLMTGIPYFLFWIIGRSKPGRENALVYLVLVHALISIIVIIGKDSLSQINGLTYIYRIDDNAQNYDIEAMINNSLSIFEFNKYSIQKTGQFHNSNALGFFSAVLLCIGIGILYKFVNFKKLKSRKNIGISILVLGILLWFNSLTRGPIILLMFILVFISSRSWKLSKNFHIYLFSGLILLVPAYFLLPSILEYLFPKFDDVSYTSRYVGYEKGFESIIRSPLFGEAPGEFPPHIYTLKIMAYNGIMAGLFITVPIVHILFVALGKFFKDIRNKLIGESTFVLMLLATIDGVFFSNGTVSYVLFGIVLAEICIRSGISLNFPTRTTAKRL